MKKSDIILQDRMLAIHEVFMQDLAGHMITVAELWRTARHSPSDSIEFQYLQKLALQLETHSATFNLLLLADQAHNLEKFLTFLISEMRSITEAHRRQVDLLLETLVATAEKAGRAGNILSEPRLRRWEPASIVPELSDNTTLIYILDTHRSWAEQLLDQLPPRYRLQVFSSYQNYSQTVVVQPPRVIITDTPLLENRNRSTRDTELPSQIANSIVPTIFVALEDTLESRLLAVRSGATEFYTLPLPVTKLTERIKDLISGVPTDPYRVLIVDHDEPLAKFYAMVLGQEGMNVSIVTNPFKTLETMAENRPEMILMNTTMPLLSGIELASIIRQEEHYAGVAIVFFATDPSSSEHLAAINAGADDVIVMPVAPDHLIAAVSARVSRARTLNSINRDLYSALRELENQQFALNQHAIVSITNINGTIVYVNDKLCEISGYTKAELIGYDHDVLNSGYHEQAYFQGMWDTVSQGKVWQGEVCNRKKNGEVYWVNMTIVPFLDEQARPYQYVAINSDITIKKFIERDLLEARDLAINASQAKSDFLSKMSHELRTPLNAILGFSQLLQTSKDQPLTHTQGQYTYEIFNAGNHLLHLINEVLDLSRIEANQLLTESVQIPLLSFLDECIALILPDARKNRIDIHSPSKNQEDINVLADPVRLKQVLANVLSNAVKYNKESGTINIDVLADSTDDIIVEITDSGGGISPEQFEKIFQPFTRLPQHRKVEGVGIGLALSRRLIELMGGRIGVRSIPARETTFWIAIPRAEPGSITNTRLLPIATTAATKPAAAENDKSIKLLYIEDNDTNLFLVKELLEERSNVQLLHDYTVTSGLETALNQVPDIILMDLDLPDMSGFNGIQMLKTSQTLADIPVIAVSAYADQEHIQKAKQLGFAEYITKPMDINLFLSMIDRYRHF